MICFKDCKSQIDLLSEYNSRLSSDLSGANKVIAEYGDIITSLTCKYKDEKLSLLQQVDELQQKISNLEADNKLLDKACGDLEDCMGKAAIVEDATDWITTSSATDKLETHYVGDNCVESHLNDDVPKKRPYGKRNGHIRKEKNRL